MLQAHLLSFDFESMLGKYWGVVSNSDNGGKSHWNFSERKIRLDKKALRFLSLLIYDTWNSITEMLKI